METGGHVSYELEVGDHCAMVLPSTDEKKRIGPKKFYDRTRPEVCVVDQKIGQNTYRLRNIHTGRVDPGTHHGRNLVKLDLGEIPVEPGQRRVMDIYENTSGSWGRHVIERFATDGRLCVRRQIPQSVGQAIEWAVPRGPEGYSRWIDPSEVQYRWVA